jgi:hypothetical protein
MVDAAKYPNLRFFQFLGQRARSAARRLNGRGWPLARWRLAWTMEAPLQGSGSTVRRFSTVRDSKPVQFRSRCTLRVFCFLRANAKSRAWPSSSLDIPPRFHDRISSAIRLTGPRSDVSAVLRYLSPSVVRSFGNSLAAVVAAAGPVTCWTSWSPLPCPITWSRMEYKLYNPT